MYRWLLTFRAGPVGCCETVEIRSDLWFPCPETAIHDGELKARQIVNEYLHVRSGCYKLYVENEHYHRISK